MLKRWTRRRLIVAQAVITGIGSLLAVAATLAGASDWLLVAIVVVASGAVAPVAIETARRRE